MKAASKGQTAVVEMLLSKGPNIEAANEVIIANCGCPYDVCYWIPTIIETKQSLFISIQVIKSAKMGCVSNLLLVILFA